MKPWQKSFAVGLWSHQLEQDNVLRGRAGDWVDSWTVLQVIDGVTHGPATKRFYSSKRDAERGAAQIYNHIEKKLLL